MAAERAAYGQKMAAWMARLAARLALNKARPLMAAQGTALAVNKACPLVARAVVAVIQTADNHQNDYNHWDYYNY